MCASEKFCVNITQMYMQIYTINIYQHYLTVNKLRHGKGKWPMFWVRRSFKRKTHTFDATQDMGEFGSRYLLRKYCNRKCFSGYRALKGNILVFKDADEINVTNVRTINNPY